MPQDILQSRTGFPTPARNPQAPPPALDLSSFEPEPPPALDLSTFEPLENVDMTDKSPKKQQYAYTGSPNRQPVQGPEEESTGESIWKELNRPHLDLTPAAERAETRITDTHANTGYPLADKILDMERGAVAGGLKGLAGVASGFTSDLGLATMALPEGTLAKAGMTDAAAALQGIRRAASLPFAIHGGQQVLNPNSTLQQRLEGAVEAAGGAAGFLHNTPYKAIDETLGKLAGKNDNGPGNPPTPPVKEPEQPNLRFDLPDHHQMDLFEPKPFSNAAPKQLQLTDAMAPPHVEPIQEGFKFENARPQLADKFQESSLFPQGRGGGLNEDMPTRHGDENTPLSNAKQIVDSLPPSPDKHGVMMTKESPFPKVDDKVLDEIIRNKQVDYQNPRIENVPLENLKGTQDSVDPDKVKEYIDQGKRPEMTEIPTDAKGRMSADAPTVIKVGDDYVLAGGHHRATADLARGEDNMQAVVYDAKVPPELLDKFKASLEKDAANRARDNQNPEDYDPNQPLFSKSEKGGVKVGVDVKQAAGELTTGYSRALPAIMVREAVQNAKDAIHHLGDEGRMHVQIDDDGFTVHDNGKGMSREELETVFSDLHSSGKANDENATGGKGIGKATYMLGGGHFSVESVKEVNGKKIKTSMAGTPEEFMHHVDVHEEEVPADTPTGTKIRTEFTPEQQAEDAGYRARGMYGDIINHSRDLNGHATTSPYGGTNSSVEPFKQTTNDKTIGKTNINGTDFSVHVPNKAKLEDRSYVDMHVLNNGMYQYSGEIYLGDKVPNMPESIIINAKPSAKEGTPEYPFPTQRESLKSDVDKSLKEFVDQVLINPQKQRKASTLKELYDTMTSSKISTDTARNSLIYDPGNRLTPQERSIVEGNHVMQQVNKFFDRVVDEALRAAGNKNWINRLEGVGTMFAEPGFFGVHVPNPETGKSSLMVNWLQHVADTKEPQQAAWDTVSTLFHEMGHIGEKKWGAPATGNIDLSPEDLSNPRLGEFMKMYLENVQHGGQTQNLGHGADWLARTADIMTKYGPSKTIGAVDELTKILTNGSKTGGYNGQTESLLQLHSERGGRAETTPDYLSPTGIKSESPTGGKDDITGGAKTNKPRAIRPTQLGKKLTADFNKPIRPQQSEAPNVADVKKVQQEIPQGQIPQRISNISNHLKDALESPKISKDEKENLVEKALNFQRTLLTSYDISAPGRQGLALIHRKEWWTSWNDMFKALGSEKGYNNVMDSIAEDPSGLFARGDKGSFANQAGLDLTDALSHKEEIFRSKWAEDYMPGVRPSVRAYTAFINKLRADTFKNMVETAGAQHDLPTAKKIADFINVATGRGNLGAFEGAAKPLAQVFFSPRLTASRLQMYTRTFNPKFYADMPPVVRQNQLRSALSLAGTGLLIGQLSKLAGASVNTDPYNSDFGKIRFGNTRIDPFAGHQQFLVAAARLLMGKSTSSTTGRTSDLNHPHFGGTTRADVFGRFVSNKLAPLPSFVWSWMQGREFDGTPFDAKKEMLSRTVPIVMQDIHDIMKDNPTLLQAGLATAASAGGFGVQTYGR